MQSAVPELALRDIHIPAEIGLFPPAIGWWIILILVPLTLFLSYKLIKYLMRKTAVKSAKKQLKSLKENQTLQDVEKLSELSSLLRRVAISVYPRSNCASLTGVKWLEFLDDSFKEKTFNNEIGQVLITGLYQKNPPENLNLPELINLSENWLKAQTKRL